MAPSTKYDCLIVGAGVTGLALLYELARFTDLKRLGLLEKCDGAAQVNSHAQHNSQTIHCGDIETNYSLEKAGAVRRTASMVVNYASALPARERDRILFTMPKMVLGVGPQECAYIRSRYEVFKDLYPRMRLLERRAIADLEPNVALIDGTWRREEILASGTPDDYSAVDFAALAQSFSHACIRLDRTTDRQITQLFSTTVGRIHRAGPDYVLETNRGLLQARSVVVCAGGHSLLMAQQLGLGHDCACLPMAGSFYFAPEALNGKVYTVQNPRLPFAAVHGDHDIKERGKTRFGPTALMLPLLERRNRETVKEFFEVLRLDHQVLPTLRHLLRVPDLRHHLLRNVLSEVPGLNRRLFVREIRKIVPSLTAADITYAEGFGGVRPLLIDRTAGTLHLGEAKITNGDGIIFNLAPSPGGTSCLGNAESDMRTLARHLGAHIDEDAFARGLLMGYEDTRADSDGLPAADEDEQRALARAV